MSGKSGGVNKKRILYRGAVFVALIAVVLVFVNNNREVIFSRHESGDGTTFLRKAGFFLTKAKEKAVFFAGRIKKTAALHKKISPDTDAVATDGLVEVHEKKNSSGSQQKHAVPIVMVSIPDIECSLRGRADINVVMSLDVAAPEFMKDEILLKRENLKVMVQKVVAGKAMDDLIVDSLRLQIKASMNGILEKGSISDIVFRDFRIDRVR
jgi:hypothetical protein